MKAEKGGKAAADGRMGRGSGRLRERKRKQGEEKTENREKENENAHRKNFKIALEAILGEILIFLHFFDQITVEFPGELEYNDSRNARWTHC